MLDIGRFLTDKALTRVAADFSTFAYTCPYFTAKTDINNGYGCTHSKNEDQFDDNREECCACLLGSCPLGYAADDESLNDPAIDWQGSKPSPGDVEDEYIIINIGPDASNDEHHAAGAYLRYINRYIQKEEIT